MFEIVRTIHAAIRSESTLAFVAAMALFFAITGGLLAWVIDAGYKREIAEKQAIKAVSIDCEMAALPIPFPSNSIIEYFDLIESSRSGLASIRSSATDKASLWPDHPGAGVTVFRCKVSNYGDDPVFAISMQFLVELLETTTSPVPIQGQYGLVSGVVTSSYSHTVSIRVLEPKGGAFTFYIRNTSSTFVRVQLPTEATYEPASRPERAVVLLKTAGTGKALTFSPYIALRPLSR